MASRMLAMVRLARGPSSVPGRRSVGGTAVMDVRAGVRRRGRRVGPEIGRGAGSPSRLPFGDTRSMLLMAGKEQAYFPTPSLDARSSAMAQPNPIR